MTGTKAGSTNDKKPLGIYIHVPFCTKKCRYCGFLSYIGALEETMIAYAEGVASELKAFREYINEYSVDTIFIGGGTPTVLPLQATEIIGNALRDTIDGFDEKVRGGSAALEFTTEANPNSLTAEKLQLYHDIGVNRISMGVQSFDEQLLQVLGRLHTPQEARDKYELIRSMDAFDVNLDLIFGIPGQTEEIWKNDLNELLQLRPDHVSCYGLQLEEGTPFYQGYRHGELHLPGIEKEREMYHYGFGQLERAGYEWYEISNAALPGKRCRHNMKYWNMSDFIGIGPGAAGFIDGYRYNEPEDIIMWLNLAMEGKCHPADRGIEKENKKDSMATFCFTALRTVDGISVKRFHELFGLDFYRVFSDRKDVLEDYEAMGMLTIDDDRIALTEKGIDMSNDIMCEFV